MESTVSVSKGVFLFPNGFQNSKTLSKKKTNLLFCKLFQEECWYLTYRKNWEAIKTKLNELNQRSYSVLLNDIVNYIKQFYGSEEAFMLEGIIPSATLLTGVSQPDHVSQFDALINIIKDEISPHVAIVNSQDSLSLKHIVENMVWQLIGNDLKNDEECDVLSTKHKLKKSQCTMKTLKTWYHSKYTNESTNKKKKSISTKTLVIVIPDFESFNCHLLQDFVMIISSYISSLPIVLVFGVATSVSALHKSFPYEVSSKLLIKVFHSHSSAVYMNQVLEDIFLTHTVPFHLSGKAFELLTDVFLFYDFSVKGLVQSIKYCMMDHFYGDNTKVLCCKREDLEEAILNLSPNDLESIRQLKSFRPYLEKQDCRTKISLFEDDQYFRDALYKELMKLHDYLYSFYLCVKLLSTLIKDIPNNLLGKTVREVYTKCATECITDTPSFKECMQLLSFQSQIKIVDTITGALKLLNSHLQSVSPIKPLQATPKKNNNNTDKVFAHRELGESFAKTVRVHLMTFLRQLENANTEASISTAMDTDTNDNVENVPGSRYKLKEKLLKATRVEKIQSEFEMIRCRFISYLEEMFAKGLQPPHTQTFHEIMFFSDISNVKKHIVGAPRGALHTALSDPAHYLQCSCCRLPSPESVAGTLPDVCLAYKLHRECGKHINLYDWLQAFAAVVKPGENDEQRHHDPIIQAATWRSPGHVWSWRWTWQHADRQWS